MAIMGFVADAEQPSSRFVPDATAKLEAPKLEGWGSLLDKAAYKLGGAVTDALAGKVPPEVAGAAGYTTNLIGQAGAALAGGGIGTTAAPVMRSAAESLMRSAIKAPPTARLKGFAGAPSKADRAVTTMLDEGVNVSEAGATKLLERVQSGKEAINKVVAGSNATIDKGAVATRLQDASKKFESQPLPEKDLATIEKAYTDFINGRLPYQIPIAQAQKIKEGGGSLLRKKYGQAAPDEAQLAAEKALVRGFKEEIELAIPEIKALNARESNLLNALMMADRRAAQGGANNIIGLAALAPNPVGLATFLADKSSAFKSVVARIINANSRTAPGTAGATVGAFVGAQSGSNE